MAGALAAGSLTGCSGGNQTAAPKESGNETTAQAGKTAGKQEKVTLRFAWWGDEGRHQATLKAIELYMDRNPNVTIEAEYGGFDGYQQKISTQLAGQTAPDIIQLNAGLCQQGRFFYSFTGLSGFDGCFRI